MAREKHEFPVACLGCRVTMHGPAGKRTNQGHRLVDKKGHFAHGLCYLCYRREKRNRSRSGRSLPTKHAPGPRTPVRYTILVPVRLLEDAGREDLAVAALEAAYWHIRTLCWDIRSTQRYERGPDTFTVRGTALAPKKVPDTAATYSATLDTLPPFLKGKA